MTYCRKPVSAGDHWLYCEKESGHVDGWCWGDGSKVAERPVVTLGRDCPHDDPSTVQLDYHKYVVVDGVEMRRSRWDRGRSLREIGREVAARLEAEDLLDESFSDVTWMYERPEVKYPEPLVKLPRGDGSNEWDKVWPERVRWVACYAVTGGSEGHYVHVDIIHDVHDDVIGVARVVRPIFLAKTFRGMAHAQKIAARCADLLGA